MGIPYSIVPLLPSTLIYQRYMVVHLIGQGGMGAVYEAIDQRLGVSVALKQTLRTGKPFERAFKAEARLLATLHHPALPRVTDFFTDPCGQFLVMEFIAGDDLEMLLKQHGKTFPVDEVLEWAEQLLQVLNYLHTRTSPIVHCDIKPGNLKLTSAGEVILLDFGLARGNTPSHILPENIASPLARAESHHHDSESTALPGSPDDLLLPVEEEAAEPAEEQLAHLDAAELLQGEGLHGFTPQYAAPEQVFKHRATPRSDLYSLAATLYVLLGGSCPASAEERMHAIRNELQDPLQLLSAFNPHVPPAVGEVLHCALALDPDERPPDAATMSALLRHARQTSTAMPPAQLVSLPSRREGVVAGAALSE